MKTRTANKIFIIAIVLMLLTFIIAWGVADAIEWHTADRISIAWDPIDTVTAPDVLTYGLYSKQLPNEVAVFIKEVTEPMGVIQFTAEGKYIVGVSAIRYIDKGTADEVRLESTINWSDVNGVNTPVPFGASYYIISGPPINLRKQ